MKKNPNARDVHEIQIIFLCCHCTIFHAPTTATFKVDQFLLSYLEEKLIWTLSLEKTRNHFDEDLKVKRRCLHQTGILK